MSAQDFDNHINDLKEGMALAEYNMLLEKARRGEMLVMSDASGNIIEIPAREQFILMYGHDIPTAAEPSAPSVQPAVPGIDSVVPAPSIPSAEPSFPDTTPDTPSSF